jgi:hypothetical protein
MIIIPCNCIEIFYDKIFYDDMPEHVLIIMLYSKSDMRVLACGLFL